MSLSKEIEKLQEIGVDAISKQTHIAPANLELLLEQNIDSFTPTQFVGFIRILEREYGVDLSELREIYSQHKEHIPQESQNDPFKNSAMRRKREKLVGFMLGAALILTLLVGVFVFMSFSSEEKIEINNTAIDKAKKNLEMLSLSKDLERERLAKEQERLRFEEIESMESNSTIDSMSSSISSMQNLVDDNSTVVVEDVVSYSSSSSHKLLDNLIIKPKIKIWMGIIDLKSYKRETRVSALPIRLDGLREWLIITGHGEFSLECGEESEEFLTRKRVMLLYADGVCSKIDEHEFRRLNRGKLW